MLDSIPCTDFSWEGWCLHGIAYVWTIHARLTAIFCCECYCVTDVLVWFQALTQRHHTTFRLRNIKLELRQTEKQGTNGFLWREQMLTGRFQSLPQQFQCSSEIPFTKTSVQTFSRNWNQNTLRIIFVNGKFNPFKWRLKDGLGSSASLLYRVHKRIRNNVYVADEPDLLSNNYHCYFQLFQPEVSTQIIFHFFDLTS